MGKTVIKDTFREIKGSFGRFFAIFAIVAIGVSFFAGITASSSDMRYSSDSYYDEYNLHCHLHDFFQEPPSLSLLPVHCRL